ncbi:MAG: hypothetical protein GOVbin2917_78 [Prokaryotic dsDNA virus sp.]|jgi:hypothetical protein|nr:MAG: hypothetical protein GOVbin2917_78 [Prokaryotic dsDNA virus sp.]|tara:strand:+ start:49940 stop:50542 length:603 start_codon:yes stop_codon:yes gene_type:complete
MTIKNKSTLGTPSFIKEFYQDCKNGIATGWWNEKFARRGELVRINHNDKTLSTVYDLINYIKESHKDITEEDIVSIANSVYNTYPSLAFKRAYLWEVDEENSFTLKGEGSDLKGDYTQDLSTDKGEGLENDSPEEPEDKEVVVEEKEESDAPDFEYAKTIKSKKELKDYAKDFGFDLDSRKSLNVMMKSFQGKYHASKGK